MHYLCDAIDLKQSLEGTLTTVLDEVYFIANLHSFLPLVPQANPSFPKVSHLQPTQAKQLSKLPPLDTSTIALRPTQMHPKLNPTFNIRVE